MVTTNPFEVAESTDTEISLVASSKVSPTVHMACASVVSSSPSVSITWAGS
jgi:hypothetical protein